MNKLVIGILLFFVMVIGFVVISFVTSYNTANSSEQSIKAHHTDMKNILGQYSLKISEAVQVNDMYKDDLKEVVIGQMSGRYGSDGSQATFQWLQENNIPLDSKMYTKLQQMIEAGRNKFENSQTMLIDVKRVYTTKLGSLWTGTMMRVAGYPKINLNDYQIVQSNHSVETFNTGIDTGLQLR